MNHNIKFYQNFTSTLNNSNIFHSSLLLNAKSCFEFIHHNPFTHNLILTSNSTCYIMAYLILNQLNSFIPIENIYSFSDNGSFSFIL